MNAKRSGYYAARALLSTNPLSLARMKALQSNEHLSFEEIEGLQCRYLYATLQTALRKLPLYKGLSTDFNPGDAKRVLRDNFPVIDKTSLLQNKSLLYPHEGKARPWELTGKTSGTTGTPLQVYRSVESAAMEQAFIRRHWAWGGFSRNCTRVTLRGDLIVPLEKQEPPFWYWNRFERQLIVSSRHLREPFVEAIINAIRAVAPHALQAYPSTAYLLATFLQQRNETLRIPLLFSASEPLYAHQRELISSRMGCTIMDMYGMAERVAFATGCEFGALHVNPDYSFVEIIDETGRPTDGIGYIVGTTFHNQLMPLVRYKLSDRTRIVPEGCRCGRPFPVIEAVTGKYEDVVTGKQGNPISPSVLTFAFKGVENIRKSQLAQISFGKWQVRVVPMPGYSDGDGARLIANIHRSVDSDIEVELILTNDLPETSAGKFRWVVNETSNDST